MFKSLLPTFAVAFALVPAFGFAQGQTQKPGPKASCCACCPADCKCTCCKGSKCCTKCDAKHACACCAKADAKGKMNCPTCDKKKKA